VPGRRGRGSPEEAVRSRLSSAKTVYATPLMHKTRAAVRKIRGLPIFLASKEIAKLSR